MTSTNTMTITSDDYDYEHDRVNGYHWGSPYSYRIFLGVSGGG